MNKKAFLLGEETLKIIIAVISITFLVYLLVSVYNASRKSEKLEQAEASLEHLIEMIDAGNEEVEIYNPAGWEIISWPGEYHTGIWPFRQTKEGIPNSCSNIGWQSCLCICDKETLDSCDEKGVCAESDFVIENEGENKIKIKNPPVNLVINQGERVINEFG